MARHAHAPQAPADNDALPAGVTPTDVVKREFGRRLHRAMIEKGWNQSDLARHANVTRDAVSTYIRGTSLPETRNLLRLAQALGIPPGRLHPHSAEQAHDEDEAPALEMKMAQNGSVWLKVNRAVPADVAVKVAALLAGA